MIHDLSFQCKTVGRALAVLLWAVTASAFCQPVPLTTLSGQLELARVVDLSAERLGLNIEYDATKLKGTVTLRLGGGVTDHELWSLTNRLLSSRGLTTVRRSGGPTISVVLLSEAAAVAQPSPLRVSWPRSHRNCRRSFSHSAMRSLRVCS